MFKDWNEVADWAKSAVEEAVNLGLMKGYPDGTFRPDQPITRVEFAQAIVNVVHMIRNNALELMDADMRNTLLKTANFIVQVSTPSGTGSGVLLQGGKILTNAHVVEDYPQVSVLWTSPYATDDVPKVQKTYNVIRKHESFDLALIDAHDVAHIPGAVLADDGWFDSVFVNVDKKFHGNTLFTVGSPVGLGGTISSGKFSGIDFYGSFFLTYSGSINPGNSGGGIFDTEGRLVSVCVAKPNNALVDGLGFGVLPLAVKKFINGEV